MSELSALLKPARGADETREDYVARRLNGKSKVAELLRGTLIHNSRPDKDKKGVTYTKVAK